MKSTNSFVILAILTLILSINANAGWELYDNFSSGSIDSQIWDIDESSATITVESGRAKFVHKQGQQYVRDSSWLVMINNPENIKGIKATVTVKSCTGDVRGQMGSMVGKIGDNYTFSVIQVDANKSRIGFPVVVIGPAPDNEYLYDLFWGSFKNPINIIATSYTIAMQFSNLKIIGSVDGLGEKTYILAENLSNTDDHFKGFGTRSNNGDGPCTVYYDDVYVYR
jgi:hypothetical protein